MNYDQAFPAAGVAVFRFAALGLDGGNDRSLDEKPGGDGGTLHVGTSISGNTVTINNGKVVTVSGAAPANVFTNNPNYSGSGGNGSTTGTFGGQGATTAPLSAGPGPGG